MKKFLALIDASGSMNPSRNVTISALNEYMKDLAKIEDLDCTIIVWNSDKYHTVYSGPVSKVPVFTREDYVCEGLTPLNDSVAKGFHFLLNDYSDKKYMLVMTDGQENDSKEYYTASDIRALANTFRNEGGKLDFIGCDIDAWAVGKQIGYLKHETQSFHRGEEGVVYKSSSSRSINYFTDSTFTSSDTLGMPDEDGTAGEEDNV